jgi:hypothetical protein
MSMDPQESGSGLAEFLLSRLEGTRLEDVYIDKDEDGSYLGLVFSDGEKEYHLTVDESAEVQLAEGPLEGDSLEEVKTFRMNTLTPPFSDDSVEE